MIRSTQIEDTIIAYFDGRLSDEESAELLHRVSVSPEIRQVFREHEIMRAVAVRAVRNTMVRPSVEAALFDRIDALAEADLALPAESAAKVWLRRLSPALLLLLFVAGGALIYRSYTYNSINGDSNNTVASSANTSSGNTIGGTLPYTAKQSSQPKSTVIAEENFTSNQNGNLTEGSSSSNLATTSEASKASLANRNEELSARNSVASSMIVKSAAKQPVQDQSVKASSDIADNQASGQKQNNTNNSAAALTSVEPRTPNTTIPSMIDQSRLVSSKLTIQAPEKKGKRYEIALQTSTGFNYPASSQPVQPFSDHRLSFGYALFDNNIIGIRLMSGIFEALPEISRTTENGIEVVRRSLTLERQFAGELFYSYRFSNLFKSAVDLDLTAGAGLKQSGYLLSAEFGFQWPLSERLFAGASFSLMRVHSSSPTMEEIMQTESSDKPIIFEGSNIHNTLKGKIHYGLSYRF